MSAKHGIDAPIADQTTQAEASDDPEVIREQIEATRAELGETVETLAAKADVKTQIKGKVKEKQEEATAKLAQVRGKIAGASPDQARAAVGSLPERIMERPLPVVVVAGILLGWLVWKKR